MRLLALLCAAATAYREHLSEIPVPVIYLVSFPGSGNTWARLLEDYDPNYTMAKEESRRCHARIIGHERRGGQRCVRLTECTPELLQAVLRKMQTDPTCADLTNGGWMNTQAPYEAETFCDQYKRVEPAEAVISEKLVTPLRQCRGKSGGMNHAVDILDAYFVRHSKLVQMLVWFQRNEVYTKTPRMFFAIFDCRHMGTQGFWDAVIPNFYRYKSHKNPWQREIEINPNVSFVQLPQTFAGLGREEDFFDMRNEYGFRMANTVRSGVGAITSCGTNAVWNYPLVDEHMPLKHRFNEETMIEDTASSHEAIINHRKGVYHFQRLVLGARNSREAARSHAQPDPPLACAENVQGLC